MNPAAWVFFGAWLVTLAALFIVLVGGSSARGRLVEIIRDRNQTIADLRADNVTLRRKLIRLVGGRPVQSIPDAAARIASGMTAAREAASIDDEWADLNGKGDAS